jgi:hypothetical protein
MTVLGKVGWISSDPERILPDQKLQALDFTCVETQVGDGGPEDCEIIELERAVTLKVPEAYR